MLLAACSKDIDSDNAAPANEPLPINFNIVSDRMSTRAGEITNDNLRQQHFRVWAYAYKNWQRDPTPYMDNVDIHYDPNSNGGEWVYTYSDQKAHWPKDPYTTLNFYAECPAVEGVRFWGTSNIADTLVAPYTTNASVLYNTKNADGTLKDKDLMIAWAYEQQNRAIKWVDGYWDEDNKVYVQGHNDTLIIDKAKKVQLTFKHALSELLFRITTQNTATRAVVRSITLGNVASLVKWHFTNEAYNPSYSNQSDGMINIPLTFDSNLNGSIDVRNDTVMINSEHPLFVPSQQVTCWYTPPTSDNQQWNSWRTATEYYLALDCDVWLGEKKVWDGATNGLLYLPFYVHGGAKQYWLIGKRYTYTINLSGGFDYNGNRVITTGNEIGISVSGVDDMQSN